MKTGRYVREWRDSDGWIYIMELIVHDVYDTTVKSTVHLPETWRRVDRSTAHWRDGVEYHTVVEESTMCMTDASAFHKERPDWASDQQWSQICVLVGQAMVQGEL